MKEFSAALFDMDGTILDSMGVWAQVDRVFFERRGMNVPETYTTDIAGLSFRETAEYTRRVYCIAEDVKDIMAEWDELSVSAYKNDIRLKPFALEYLQKLKRDGVKLAVATALTERMYKPALENNGIIDLFDAFASTEETTQSKSSGEIYLLAARRLGVKPEECCVFEDIFEGLTGAKKVGMSAVYVYDKWTARESMRCEQLADKVIHSFSDVL